MNPRPFITSEEVSVGKVDGHVCAITAWEWCQECGGDGSITTVGSGYYSSAQEQWYPNEEEEPCEYCEGSGEVLTSRCAVCGQEVHDCECDEDLVLAWVETTQSMMRALGSVSTVETTESVVHYIAALRGDAPSYSRGFDEEKRLYIRVVTYTDASSGVTYRSELRAPRHSF